MKKKVLLSSIMFSTLILGGNVFVESANNVLAIEHTENDNNVNNEIQYVDEYGNVVGNGFFSGLRGQEYNIKDIWESVHLYFKYKLDLNQPSKITLKGEGTIIKIKVLDNRIKNYLVFKDEDNKEVGRAEVKGLEGGVDEISKSEMPRNYVLADDQSNRFIFGKSGHEIPVRVIYKGKDITLRFIKSDGSVETVSLKLMLGDSINLEEHCPKGYELDWWHKNIVITEENLVIEDRIYKSKIKHNVKFIDEDGKYIGNPISIEGKEGERIEEYISSDNIPEGYQVIDSMGVIEDNDKDIVIKIVEYNDFDEMQSFLYVNKDGDVIGRNSIGVKKDKPKKVEPLTGYKIIGNDTVSYVESEEDSKLPRIVLEGLPQVNVLHLKDAGSGKKVQTIKVNGKTGDKIDLSKYLNKYIVSQGSEDQLFISATDKEKVIFISKIINTELHFVLANGTIVGKKNIVNPEGRPIDYVAPKGYLIVGNAANNIFSSVKKPVQNILVVPANGVALPEDPTKVTAQINLIDQNSNKAIHSYIAQGKHGQKMDIQLPDGYEFAKGSSKSIVLDKSKKSFNIYVIEKSPVTSQTAHLSTVQTKQTTSLFDKNGKQLRNRALAFNTGWKTDQKLVLNGVTYYRVGNNEYVKASDIVEYEAINKVVNTTSGSAKYLYDINGKKSSLRALASGSAWFSDKVATINGEKMYRVATNEWVKASDVL